MPAGRPQIDLEPYKDKILFYYQTNNRPVSYICARLNQKYGLQCSERTMHDRLKHWDITKRQSVPRSEVLEARIRLLFYEVGLSEAEMFKVLRTEGVKITQRNLGRYRRELGLRRRLTSREMIDEADRAAEDWIKLELEEGPVEGFGQEYLYSHFRQKGYILARFV
jgi:hypothetical protein